MVREIAAIRLALTTRLGQFASEAAVLALAEQHLPVLASFDRGLHDELVGIAEGAAVSPAHIVVLNHYTDLRDSGPAMKGAGEDDCSAVWARAASGDLLGQTWDMHGSAAPYVMMLRVPARDGAPPAWLFTITGCLGMTGLNGAGVGVTINNLKSKDGRVGVVWSALVRRALTETHVGAARDVLLGADIGSGHHYLVASKDGAFGIETSGVERRVVFEAAPDATGYVHTNHCLDPDVGAVTAVSPESTTHDCYDALSHSLAERPVDDRADLWARLGSHAGYPRSVCTHLAGPDTPHAMATCGGLVMDLRAGDLWATDGCLYRARPHRFAFDASLRT